MQAKTDIEQGLHGLTLSKPIIPASDGAGVILATGAKAILQPGDLVCTHLLQHKPAHEPVTFPEIMTGLGHGTDGTIRKCGVFHESALLRMPQGLSFVQASTLSCAGLTAWNALYGLRRASIRAAGDDGENEFVLVQGTGGVSVLAMQFALAAGATVIATTSTAEKMQKLRSLGAHHVINYREDVNWGETAKALTPNARGVDVVVDVGGSATLEQSFTAIRSDGLVSITGLLGEGNPPSIMACMAQGCVARGVLLGTKAQFEEMNAFIGERGVKPLVDERVFKFNEVKKAYKYLMGQKHFSNVCIHVQ